MKAQRSRTVSIRMTPQNFALAETAAGLEARSVSNLCEVVLMDFMRKKHPALFLFEAKPTYFVQHPDGSYSEADPQPL